MSSERPSSPEAIKPSFVEQKAKEVREDLADLLESSDFSGEVQKLEQRFSEKLDREGFIEAFSLVYLAIIEGRLLGNEEQVAYEILDAMRMRKENSDPLWLRSLTGQIVAGFMKGLVNEQIRKKEQEPDPIFEQLKQVDKSTSEEHRFEIADAFFKPNLHSSKSLFSRLLEMGLLYIRELATEERDYFVNGPKIYVRKEFILPWIPVKEIPSLDTLEDPKGYCMADVEINTFFPRGVPRSRKDFGITPNDLDLIGYQKEMRSVLLSDLEKAREERFPFCTEFDISEPLKVDKKDVLTTAEVLEALTEGTGSRFKYIPASIDHHLALAAFAWDQLQNPYVSSLDSMFVAGEGRNVARLRIGGDLRYFHSREINRGWNIHNNFFALRKSF